MEKREFIKQIFTEIAPFYDRVNALMSFGLVGRWRYCVLQKCNIKPGSRILDVCTGTGEMAYLLARAAGLEGQVIGLDNCPEMLETARQKAGLVPPSSGTEGQVPCPSFMEGDAQNLPFPTGMFDCVTTVLALRNLSDLAAALQEMARVCAANGRVVCLDISEPVNFFLRAGFKLYFHGCIPALGNLFGRPGYTWLSQSLRGFPARETLTGLLQNAGFSEVECTPLSGGVVTLYAAVKTGAKRSSYPKKELTGERQDNKHILRPYGKE
ncbi:MAG: ubiquinone/menaquinone biosynthesis methyltransferase [Clostridia bacterium]|jgi:demethylmenaquinone methyltransferase/2-methoxy-6-polyprenyl-1,4-benzoquinol methylase|nr:ubiquinone/menaquinone biosynthesis methyltransferase [Clostridia bacterium]